MPLKAILIVEDSELLHRMYDLILIRHKAQGTKILHAYHGKDGLEKLERNPETDLVLLDINMPVMSGLEFLQHCREQNILQTIPVVIISTEGKEDDTRRGLQAGARAYVTKPFHPNDLHRVIERIFPPDPASAAPQNAMRR